MNKYEIKSAVHLPQDLKHYGRRRTDREYILGALIVAIGAALFIGFILGQLWR